MIPVHWYAWEEAFGAMPARADVVPTCGMLWFYAGWYAGAVLADMFGISLFLGPVIGVAAAALIVGDPRRIIWTSRATNATVSTVVTGSLTEAA